MVRASISASEMISEERMSFAASGWRAMLSIAVLAVIPCAIEGPSVLIAIASAAAIAITDEFVILITPLFLIFSNFF